MKITLCDNCDTEGATFCYRHQVDECDACADVCRANGTWALSGWSA